MKLDAIDKRWLTQNTDIMQFEIDNGSVYLGDDGAIYSDKTVRLYSVQHIPLQFGAVLGDFNCGNILKVMKGVPRACHSFTCNSVFIDNFEHLPACGRSISLQGVTVKRLTDVLKHIKADVGMLDLSICAGLKDVSGMDTFKFEHKLQTLRLSSAYTKNGGLGLLMIPGIQSFNFGTTLGGQRDWENTKRWPDNKANAGDAFAIINSFVDHPEDIFECQQILIDEGLEQFAQL